METPMSTHAPRMAELWKMYGDGKIELITVAAEGEEIESDLIATQTELTAALARIAELENTLAKIRNGLLFREAKAEQDKNASLTRQLSESQAQLTKSESKLIEANHVCHERAHIIGKLEAQLASAREDGARLDWLDSITASANMKNGTECGWRFIQNHFRTELSNRHYPYWSIRSAIDSARGATSPPAVGEKDAWHPIETAPKKGRAQLLLIGPNNELEFGYFCELSQRWNSRYQTWLGFDPVGWQSVILPPPPQGKE